MKISLLLFCFSFLANAMDAPLPDRVKAVWDFEKAFRETTPNCERVCLNGLWRWQPASDEQGLSADWGWFKVPGAWPGITDYMQKDSQTLFRNDAWKDVKLSDVTAAWQEREITIPKSWEGRRIALQADYLNSFASVFVDGTKAGEMQFPSSEVDLTALCAPGVHTLRMLVIAMPLKGVLLSYIDSAHAREVKGSVARRGLCGDVFLSAITANPRIASFKIDTSIRNGEISFTTTLSNVTAASWRLRAQIAGGPEFIGAPNQTSFRAKWKPGKLWDLHTSTNQFEATLSLCDDSGRVIDSTPPKRFGFRELWINGRDFYLNGSRIFLSAVPLDNAEVGAAWATYEAAKESLLRLKSFGINFVYTHNYGCEPGSHLSFEEILRAADDVGMLVALSQPHFSHYDWKMPNADAANGYARHAEFYTRVAGNHPSVVFYSMSHNATGYDEDMNPDLIDGRNDPRDQWFKNNAQLALRAEAIVTRLDPARIVYHHASGNLGAMHDMNFYPNFVPIQELSDWFGHWSTNGVKPAFMCEYGAPFTWDWTMYRGWYNGQREWGSARVPWEYSIAEWNAQFLGARAFNISEAEKRNLRWEAAQYREGKVWHRWDYPTPVGSTRFDEQYPIHAMYLTDNWRAFRGWGVSGISPWEYEHFWKVRDGVDRARRDFKTDWEHLQHPGYSPDYLDQRYERMDLAFEKSDWIPTAAAQALYRNNGPLLAFIAGKPDAFTSKDHNFAPGEIVEKQIIVINNSRETQKCALKWNFGSTNVQIQTGEQARIPLKFAMPKNDLELKASIQFSNVEAQEDSFTLHALAPTNVPKLTQKIALFDPVGETENWLRKNQILLDRVEATSPLDSYDLLIVGKKALTVDGAAPDISRVAKGLKVLIFEQTARVLERRFGFRVEEYGLRNVFARIPDHPILAGIAADQLRDWRGSSTLISPQLDYQLVPRRGPTVEWAGLQVPHLWRCGNRGDVASVLIEKPPCGDFLPIIDGGFSLQYSPLLEYREGAGVVLFCQLDVTARTERDPVADAITLNTLKYLADWKASPKHDVAYGGHGEVAQFLERLGVHLNPGGEVGVSGPLGSATEGILIGGANDYQTFEAEHISTYFESEPMRSPFAGISPAELHNRNPRKMTLMKSGGRILGDGALAQIGGAVWCAVTPVPGGEGLGMNRRTYRRSAFLVSRLLGNAGANFSTPLLARFHTPPAANEKRFLIGFYIDQPEEWDDPYRFFRW
jgi:beta-galactosidase